MKSEHELICATIKPHACCDCDRCRKFMALLERGSAPYIAQDERDSATNARVIRAVARRFREEGDDALAGAFEDVLALLERRMVGA